MIALTFTLQALKFPLPLIVLQQDISFIDVQVPITFQINQRNIGLVVLAP